MVSDGQEVGKVTSGGPAPFLRKNIGMAYVPPKLAVAGAQIEITIRGQASPARIVEMPFYKRPKQVAKRQYIESIKDAKEPCIQRISAIPKNTSGSK